MYGVLPYFLGKIMPELILETLAPSIVFVIVYWVAGLNTSTTFKPLLFCNAYLGCILLLTQMTGASLGLLLGAIYHKVEVILNNISAILIPLMLYCGFFVNPKSLPDATAWIAYLSPYKYAFSALAQNQYHGVTLDCEDDDAVECHPLGDLDLKLNMIENIVLLGSIALGLRLASFLALKALAYKALMSKA
jgi:ABC-type multidrug transport system permease subunit